MSASLPLYQSVLERISLTAKALPKPARTRLALLVTGMLAARSSVCAHIAPELLALGLTKASDDESIQRRLRRTLADQRLRAKRCYAPVLAQVLDWAGLQHGSRRVVLAVDESSKTDQVHLLRISLCYWGGSLPLCWRSWPQNVPQAPGHYWQQIDELFDEVAALVPTGLEVVLVADRAYAVPNFIDRCSKRGWHYVIRVLTNGSHCYRDRRGVEQPLRQLVRRRLGQRGQRFKAAGELFKGEGWRKLHLVGMWSQTAKEPLVVLSDLALSWSLLGYYERRFWIEPGFRNDKSRGWQWEQSQVQAAAHQPVLLLGMAWASLVTMCVGVAEAKQREAREQQKRAAGSTGRPRRAKQSIFTLGLRALRGWLYGTRQQAVRWQLPELDGVSWLQRWHNCQSQGLLVASVVCSA